LKIEELKRALAGMERSFIAVCDARDQVDLRERGLQWLMTREQVQANLEELGVNVGPAVQKVKDALARVAAERTEEAVPEVIQADVMETCHSQADGDCAWQGCPQNKDDEPMKTGRHCPLDTASYEE
jgi:hypothetical protein